MKKLILVILFLLATGCAVYAPTPYYGGPYPYYYSQYPNYGINDYGYYGYRYYPNYGYYGYRYYPNYGYRYGY